MRKQKFVVCINNAGYKASLELRKLYESRPDAKAAKSGFMRVVDESGDDYLYPKSLFETVDLRVPVEEKVRLAA